MRRPFRFRMGGRKNSNAVNQVIVQIEALEETGAHVVGQVRSFGGRVDEIDGPLGGVQHDTAIVTSREMLFDLLAEFGSKLTVDVLGQGT